MMHRETAERQSMSIIVTTTPDVFSAYFAGQQAHPVLVTDNSQTALAALGQGRCSHFFADYRSLEDKWTGQHFLRYMREHSEFRTLKVWLMAEQWHQHQEQWAIKCGAVGMVLRTPEAVADLIAGMNGHAQGARRLLEAELTDIDEIFGRFAGPMRQVHIEAVRGALRMGSIQPVREAYVQELASKFTLPDRRIAFLNAVADL